MPINNVSLIMVLATLLALVFVIFGFSALRRGKLGGGLTRIIASLLLLVVALAAALLNFGTLGYQALTQEVRAATIELQETGPQRYRAKVYVPGSEPQEFDLSGDEVYVDAHILKWKPVMNVLGLTAAYELDRLSGRYISLDDEQTQPRTLYSLKQDKSVDVFELARRYAALNKVVDAEYGSATFIPVENSAVYEIRVSTTGLLARRVR